MQKTELLVPGSSPDIQSLEWLNTLKANCKQWIINFLVIVACAMALAVGIMWGVGIRLMLEII